MNVFISCPLRNWNKVVVEDNVERAEKLCRRCYEIGAIPLCPTAYLPHFLTPGVEKEDVYSMMVSLDWIKHADVMWVSDVAYGITVGMQEEIEYAKRCNIPILYASKNEF